MTEEEKVARKKAQNEFALARANAILARANAINAYANVEMSMASLFSTLMGGDPRLPRHRPVGFLLMGRQLWHRI